MENVICILGRISLTCLTRRSFEITPHWIQATPFPECGCSNQEWAWGQCSRRSPAFPPSWNPTGPDKECYFQNWRLQDPNRVRSILVHEATQTSKTFGTGRFEQTSKKLEWVLGSKGSAQKVLFKNSWKTPIEKKHNGAAPQQMDFALHFLSWILGSISSCWQLIRWFGDIKIKVANHIIFPANSRTKVSRGCP